MLKKSQRLTKEEFDGVIKNGAYIHSPLFTVRYMTGEITKVSAVMPKKICNKATKRNYARRRIYEAVGKVLPRIKYAAHVIIIAKKDVKGLKADYVTAEIGDLFRNLGLKVAKK